MLTWYSQIFFAYCEGPFANTVSEGLADCSRL
jgi:hypothetical protein